MGAAYQIFGKTFQPHQLALATLGSVVLLVLPKPWGPPSPTHHQLKPPLQKKKNSFKNG